MIKIVVGLLLLGAVVVAPLFYAGPQLVSDLRAGKTWTIATDLAIKASRCTHWYVLVSTCDVQYVHSADPGRMGGMLGYLVIGNWAGERVTLMRSAGDPSRIGTSIGLEHMRARIIAFGVFTVLALAYLVFLLRRLVQISWPAAGTAPRPASGPASAPRQSHPGAPPSFGRRTGAKL